MMLIAQDLYSLMQCLKKKKTKKKKQKKKTKKKHNFSIEKGQPIDISPAR